MGNLFDLDDEEIEIETEIDTEETKETEIDTEETKETEIDTEETKETEKKRNTSQLDTRLNIPFNIMNVISLESYRVSNNLFYKFASRRNRQLCMRRRCEYKIVQKLKHYAAYSPQLLDFSEDMTQIVLIYEYMKKSIDLFEFFKRTLKDTTLFNLIGKTFVYRDEKLLARLVLSATVGLYLFQLEGVMMRDVKMENILCVPVEIDGTTLLQSMLIDFEFAQRKEDYDVIIQGTIETFSPGNIQSLRDQIFNQTILNCISTGSISKLLKITAQTERGIKKRRLTQSNHESLILLLQQNVNCPQCAMIRKNIENIQVDNEEKRRYGMVDDFYALLLAFYNLLVPELIQEVELTKVDGGANYGYSKKIVMRVKPLHEIQEILGCDDCPQNIPNLPKLQEDQFKNAEINSESCSLELIFSIIKPFNCLDTKKVRQFIQKIHDLRDSETPINRNEFRRGLYECEKDNAPPLTKEGWANLVMKWSKMLES
jgi:hypothetical protein